jgi:uncharacterized protein YwqG
MIAIKTQSAEGNLFGQSKWWGFPDLPEELDWPSVPVNDDGDEYDDPLTFICQIRCEELAPLDPEGLLPHTGMLWFFASLDYFLGNLDAVCPGMGEWEYPYFRVFYSNDLDSLHEHTLLYDDGTPAVLPAEEIHFSRVSRDEDSYTRLLGQPFYEEVSGELPGLISLLQLDEDDRWGLRFFDSGMLNFMISPEDLAARRFSAVRAWLHSA